MQGEIAVEMSDTMVRNELFMMSMATVNMDQSQWGDDTQ